VVVTPSGNVLAQIALDRAKNYVVTASVTALGESTDGLQCRLSNSDGTSWDDLGENDLGRRISLALEHAYPTKAPGFGTYTAYVSCASLSGNFTVDTGHLYALQVGAITNASAPHVIYTPPARSLTWQ
jgi:hypothetical protein